MRQIYSGSNLPVYAAMYVVPMMFLFPGMVLWQLAPIRAVPLVAILISHGHFLPIAIIRHRLQFSGEEFLLCYWIVLTIVSIGLAATGLLFGH